MTPLWRWRLLCGAGAACAVAACGVIPLVDHLIRREAENVLVVDTHQKWEDRHTGIAHPYDVTVWNCTNLRDVVADGSRPRLEEVTAHLTYVEEGYDLKWVDDREAYEYKSWWTYVPVDDAESERLDARGAARHDVLPR